jgi:hypothetical protein
MPKERRRIGDDLFVQHGKQRVEIPVGICGDVALRPPE